jgi:two-component system sensor histidine kinase CpxA
MSDLVRQLLALASLQSSARPQHCEPVDLNDVVAQVIDDLTFEFHDRARLIRTLPCPLPVVVLGDAALLRRAVENVLRNALFYTPDDCAVEVAVASEHGVARVAVSDHGPGVPDSALAHLFEPFFRVDEARARHTGGVGLGLAITRRAVELHGGRISAANTRPHGLAVRIEVPEADHAAVPAQQVMRVEA